MGYPLSLALRYLGSKKRASISVGTAFAILGVSLGVAALLTVMSVTGGFQDQFREKVLGVNAHVLVLKPEFRNYREIMERVRKVPGVANVAPFSINPMMLTHGEKTSTGVLVKGVDPEASLGVGLAPGIPPVLDLPRHVVRGEGGECPKPSDISCGIRMLDGLRREGAEPPLSRYEPFPMPVVPQNGSPAPAPMSPPLDIDLGPSPSGAPSAAPGGAPRPAPGGAPSAAPSSGGGPGVDGGVRDDVMEFDGQDMSKSARPAAPKADAPGPKASASASSAPEAAPEPDLGTDGGSSASPEAAGDDDGPQGSVTPDGGYASQLPEDDDEVLSTLVKDPCDDAEEVKKLPGVVVGVSLAESLDLQMGSCVTISSPTIGFQYAGGAIKAPVAKSFRVMAMFEAGFDQYDSKLVYTDLYEAQQFGDEGDIVTGVEMRIDDIDRSDEIVVGVTESLPGCTKDLCSYKIMDWKELNHGLFTALLIQQIGMSAVLALIILVAAFTVVATLIMVVLDKKKEISVLKAMGATDGAILRVFLYQGGIIGGLGTSIGLLIGYAVCKTLIVWAFPLDPKVYFISHLPVLMRWQEFAITGTVALGLCLLATIIPSLYAANIRPAEGFRDQ